MNLTASIESAELHFRQILEEFFISAYDEKHLFSHGVNHHRRVWNYAKEILLIPSIGLRSDIFSLPPKLIIACYMHDIGMSIDQGSRHGKHSRELCRQFMKNNSLEEDDYRDVLNAVEHHDRKEYSSDSQSDDLLRILSAADDLDAFGYIGIYRFSEIYLARGINPGSAGHAIMENAAVRFRNLEKEFRSHPSFVNRHRYRYQVLNDFFVNFNDQSGTYDFDAAKPESYGGIMQLFNLINIGKLEINDLLNDTGRFSSDPVICNYLSGLSSELKSL